MTQNRLAQEQSPYLIQHAHNPVDWYAWGEEAFEKAKREDKPVFLSIGYSTCHWCHVMAHESFEDEEVARLLNDTFINIKVDREERPDIDAVYMKACYLMTKSGGWPLTVMMTPDKKPFMAGTYIPKATRYGRVGLMEMIPEVARLWREQRPDVLAAASAITRMLSRQSARPDAEVGEEALHGAYSALYESFDEAYGGFGGAPKFPSPHNLTFLLRYWQRTGEARSLGMVEQTFQNMRRGGIYDAIGFGIHRYATDEKWIVPHFEKMLYDQAMTAIAASELYLATQKAEYAQTAREIFEYVLRDLLSPEGGFYSAEDADSEGVEGKFYVWTKEEIRDVLTREEADAFLSRYCHQDDALVHGMQELPSGSFIAHLKPAAGVEEDLTQTLERMEGIRQKLFAVREKRVRPHLDDKILTDWNALMIAALAKGAQAVDEPLYLQAAKRAMDYLLQFLQRHDGRLLHRYRNGQAAIDAHLDDYVFMIWALLELYDASFEERYLIKALEFQTHLSIYFRDEENGGYFFTAADAEALLTRPKEFHDGAIPSGNSVAFQNALRLSRITGDVALDEQAREVFRAFGGRADAMPAAFTQFLSGLDFAIGPSCEVIICGRPDAEDTLALLGALRKSFMPNKVVVLKPEGDASAEIETLAPYLQAYKSLDGNATAFVCTQFSCAEPTTDAKRMLALLHRQSK